jgi:hypothetical protein
MTTPCRERAASLSLDLLDLPARAFRTEAGRAIVRMRMRVRAQERVWNEYLRGSGWFRRNPGLDAYLWYCEEFGAEAEDVGETPRNPRQGPRHVRTDAGVCPWNYPVTSRELTNMPGKRSAYLPKHRQLFLLIFLRNFPSKAKLFATRKSRSSCLFSIIFFFFFFSSCHFYKLD